MQEQQQQPTSGSSFRAVLARQSCPEVAGALRAAAGGLIDRWQEAVRHALPTADVLTFGQLRDDLPAVLEQMARALESDQPGPTDRLTEISPAHGGVRYRQEFKLDEMLVEYILLRHILVEEVTRHLGRPMAVGECLAVNAAVDETIRRATVDFVEHQNRRLKAATEAQSKYLSFLSHDLRGGLNGIFLMIEVLKRELLKEPKFADAVDDLEMMRRSITETIGTMDRFLHAERFRKGKVQVRPGRLRLHSLLNEFASHFGYQAKDKGLELKVEAPADCEVITDRELLGLIVQNLLANAIKYAGRGAVRVSATCVNGGTWRVAVSDQGPGIAPEKLNELFGAFSRGETHGQPGVGLGLSIARQAAHFLSARLWAESQMGQGTTFYLELPKDGPRPTAEPAKAP
jgi:signal transduction histidine kinase